MNKSFIYTILVFLLMAGTSALIGTEAQVSKASSPVKIQKEGRKFGLVNERGKQLLPARYDSLQPTPYTDLFIAYLLNPAKELQVGLINSKGKELIPIQHAGIKSAAYNRFAVTDRQNKVALFDETGQAKTAFIFDDITAFHGKLARFYQQGKAGVVDINGRIRLEARYQDVVIRNDQTVDAIPLRKWTITNGNNKLLHTLEYDSIRPLGQDRWAVTTRFYDSVGRPTQMTALTDASGSVLLPYKAIEIASFEHGVAKVQEGNRYGLIDRQGKYALLPEWDSLAVVQGVAVAGVRINTNWYWHLFTLQGKKLSRHTYERIIPLEEGPLPAKRDGHWGYIDSQGQEILLSRYDETFPFEGELARVRFNGQEGVINKDGLWQIRPIAEHITILSPSRFLARLKNSYQLLDNTGAVLFETASALTPIKGGIAEISPDHKWGLISIDGKRLTFPIFDKISDLQEGLAFIATKEGKRGILSPDGIRYIEAGPTTWERLYNLHEGFIGAQIGRQQGFVDTNGKLRIANRYDTVTFFSDGMAAIAIRGKWGYVDKIERLRIQPVFDKAQPYKNGTAIVQLANKQGIVDKKGNFILPIEYDRITRLGNDRYLLQQGGQIGLADAQGNRIVSPKYDAVKDLHNGYLIVSRNGKKGLITSDGVGTIPIIYDVLIYDPKNELYLATDLREGIQRIKLEP